VTSLPIPWLVYDFTGRAMQRNVFSERRRERRVNLTSRLQGHLIALDEPVSVLQVSEGGMTLSTRSPLSARSMQEFYVWVGAEPLLVQGEVRHTRVVVNNDDVTYQTGIQFVDPPAELLERLEELLAPVPLERSA
jgi:hypothetical protein